MVNNQWSSLRNCIQSWDWKYWNSRQKTKRKCTSYFQQFNKCDRCKINFRRSLTQRSQPITTPPKNGGSMVKWRFVLRIKFCAGRQVSAPKSPSSCSYKTLNISQTFSKLSVYFSLLSISDLQSEHNLSIKIIN